MEITYDVTSKHYDSLIQKLEGKFNFTVETADECQGLPPPDPQNSGDTLMIVLIVLAVVVVIVLVVVLVIYLKRNKKKEQEQDVDEPAQAQAQVAADEPGPESRLLASAGNPFKIGTVESQNPFLSTVGSESKDGELVKTSIESNPEAFFPVDPEEEAKQIRMKYKK